MKNQIVKNMIIMMLPVLILIAAVAAVAGTAEGNQEIDTFRNEIRLKEKIQKIMHISASEIYVPGGRLFSSPRTIYFDSSGNQSSLGSFSKGDFALILFDEETSEIHKIRKMENPDQSKLVDTTRNTHKKILSIEGTGGGSSKSGEIKLIDGVWVN